MREKNSSQRKTVALFMVYYSMICFVLAGCTALDKFSSIEAEALKYGTISVGAVRMMDYNDPYLENSRKQLRKALQEMRDELRGTTNTESQICILSLDAEKGTVTLGISESKQKPDKTVKLASPELSKIFKDISQTPHPSETEMVGLRMAALKLIESELEDLNLDKVHDANQVYGPQSRGPNVCEPNDYSRMVISLDCSAWVRGKAGAALVYIDLYPYGADDFCHKTAKMIKDKDYKKNWKKLVKNELALRNGPNSLDPCTIGPPDINEEDMKDPVAYCHNWLKKNKLYPHIINVERMGKAEYLILAEGDYRGSEFGISGGYPVGGLPITASAKRTSEKKDELVTATARPLSLAFVAGDRRAGWLFMPSKTRQARMSPTERRLRMVVDIPDKLSKLTIHVHKVFLGPDLGILPDARFSKQIHNLNESRRLLKDVDPLYKEYEKRTRRYPSPRHYRIIKSRMRNLLYQGWSEEIVLKIPQKKVKDETLRHK